MQGGELYERILEKTYYSETEARVIFWQILDGVRYLHRNKIVHRDLKPENIVFTDDGGGEVVKIIDFGVSSQIVNRSHMSTAIGTPAYMAP